MFYRASARDMAEKTGVGGWVKNTQEGHVEAMVSGSIEAVDQFIRWCRQGPPDLKKGTYRHWIQNEPVQFTGFKLFYVNDTEKSGLKEMMRYEDILKLTPKPVYIQYQ